MDKSQLISPITPQKRIDEHQTPTEDSLLLAAPPGFGEPAGVVIPDLLSYSDSVVVHDPLKDSKL